MTGLLWVDGAAGWGWWVGFLIPLAVGLGVGWFLRGVYVYETRRGREWATAQRAARVYQQEIERAQSHHPAFRRGGHFADD